MKRNINKWFWGIMVSFILMFLLTGSVFAKSVTVDYKSGSGDIFKTNDYVYYKVNVSFPDYYTVFGIYGFTSWDRYYTYTNSCSSSAADDGKTTWKNRYAYTLCDKNKKTIDPAGWHKPGKKNYRTGYFLKKGVYYIRIKTGKKKCNVYGIRSILISAYYGSQSNSYKNDGGETKKKAALIKSPDQVGFSSHNELFYYSWHGSYISFPLMASGKNAKTWFKYYSDGSTPLYAVVRLGHSSGKWDMVVYGPSYPKGRVVKLPEKSVIDKMGSAHFYKDGKEVRWGNVVTLARSNGYSSIGPAPGWYYFRFMKRRIPGKKSDYYEKCSFCGDIYITKNKSLVY